ncbi:MAG: acyl-CoA dehydrogenase family protein [Longimicrobiales bacterium]
MELAAAAEAFATETLAGQGHPEDDAEARTRARDYLVSLGGGGWFDRIERQDLRACCLVREALAGASPLADAVFALQALAATPILLFANDETRERWLPALIAGDAMGAFAMTEPGAGSDVQSLATTAVKDGDHYVLNGRKSFISNAGIADVYVMFASTDSGAGSRALSTFVVPADTEGFSFAGAQVMSAPHPLGELELDDCRVPAAAMLGREGDGFKIGMATLDRLRPTVAAAACGMAERALTEAIAHALERHQFGQALADFQLIQQKLARMATELAAARFLVYRAAWEKDQGAERITLEAAMAKAYATEAAQRIVDDAVQILGGRGVLADSVVDHLYRAVRALRIYEGTTEIQHLVIAGQVLKRYREKGSAP